MIKLKLDNKFINFLIYFKYLVYKDFINNIYHNTNTS